MSEQASNIGDENQSYQQSFQSQSSFQPPFEGIKTELHTIVDELQRDEPSGKPPRRPLWQRVLIWQIPIWLVAFLVILSYNPRVDSCGGVKINYKTQTLCIANDNDFFLFVEHFTCDFIEKGAIINDSVKMDSIAQQVFNSYYSKHNIFIKDLTTEKEILTSMRNARYDTTSFCHNVAVAYWNAGVRLLNEGKKDSACVYFKKLEQWNGADSVLTAADRAVIKRNCDKESPIINQPVTPPKKNEKPKTPPKTKQEPIKTEPNPRQLNLKAQTAPPSVSLGKKTDLQPIESPNRQNAQQTPPFDPKQQTLDPFEGQMVYVDGGTFMMGSNDKEADKTEQPVHKVTLSSFSIGKYEVTQKQWQAVMGTNPSLFKGCDDCPVERVSWDDIQAFLLKLNTFTKKNYRLPTEAEWEFAARGGMRNNPKQGDFKYAGSNNIDEVAWYSSNSGRKTHPVGGKQPNQLGLYDMSGNVLEYCPDYYDRNYYKSSPDRNPRGPAKGNYRVLRGGSWAENNIDCRVSVRNGYYFNDNDNLGFRLAVGSD